MDNIPSNNADVNNHDESVIIHSNNNDVNNHDESVEWIEPRLNLSQDLWGASNVESDEDLVPGIIIIVIIIITRPWPAFGRRA